ncbi:MAG: cytochrome c biogenesis protein ResB [Planctomycetota bacterium]
MLGRILKQGFHILGSFGCAAVLLLLMFVVVFWGTWDQQYHSLYDVQKMYFDSFYVVRPMFEVGDFRFGLPLPGGMLLMGLLFVNLVVGGIIRMRRSWSIAGIYIAHAGILFMLFAGLVKFGFADEGSMKLYESQQGNEFESWHEWELAIQEKVDGGVREHIVPQAGFAYLDRGERASFHHEGLPFDLTVSRYARNSQPAPVGPFGASGAGIDGFFLRRLRPAREAENNMPGLYASVREEASGEVHKGLLWGAQQHPWVVEVGGKSFAIDLRRKRWVLPFTIQLEKFKRELHPRTSMAKAFSSDVKVIENDVEQPVKISMNQPLRLHGYVLFQHQWDQGGPGGALFSIFSVVRNPSDKWPEWACYIIAVGLLLHFSIKLNRYIRSQTVRLARANAK